MKKIFIIVVSIFCFYGCKSLNSESETASWGTDATDVYAQVLAGEQGLYGYMLRQYCNDKKVLSYANGELHALYTNDFDESNRTLIKKPRTLWEQWISCDYNTEVCNIKEDTFSFSNKYQILTQTPDYIMVEEYTGEDSIQATRNTINSLKNGRINTRISFMKLDIRNPSAVTKTTNLIKVTLPKTEICRQYREYLTKEYGSHKVAIKSKKGEDHPLIVTLESGATKFRQTNALESTLYSKISHPRVGSSYTVWLGTNGYLKDVGVKFTSSTSSCSTGTKNITIDGTTKPTDCKDIRNVDHTFNLKEFHVIGK